MLTMSREEVEERVREAAVRASEEAEQRLVTALREFIVEARGGECE